MEKERRLRKIGVAHLEKVIGFHRERNYVQTLRWSELALTNLKKLSARPIEVIYLLSETLAYKYDALKFSERKQEALECAKERYSLWAAGYMRHYGMLGAAFKLIEGLIHNKEYDRAELTARTAFEMITAKYDNTIPESKLQEFLADGSHYLAAATFRLSMSESMSSEEKKQRAVEKAHSLIHQALEIHNQLYGAESEAVACDMSILAQILSYLNGPDDVEVISLYEKLIDLYSRVNGRLSSNVALTEFSLAHSYDTRATKARESNNLDCWEANTKLVLKHAHEALRIFRALNHMERAGVAAQLVSSAEEVRRLQIRIKLYKSALKQGDK